MVSSLASRAGFTPEMKALFPFHAILLYQAAENAKPVIARRPRADAAIPNQRIGPVSWIATAALRPRDDIYKDFFTTC
jgi:hypothetical protein